MSAKCWSLFQGKASHFDGLVQERCSSSALAMELHLSCTNPLICKQYSVKIQSKYIEKGMRLKMSTKCWSYFSGSVCQLNQWLICTLFLKNIQQYH